MLAADPGVSVLALVREPAPFLDVDQTVVDLAGDPGALAAAFEDVDAVVHLAGHNEVVASAQPELALTETVQASLRVAEATVASGAKRLVYVSTIHVYGAAIVEGAVLGEDVAPEPRTPYALARLASEHLLAAAGVHGVEVVVLRLTNAVGAPAHPHVDRWTLVANDLCRQAVTTGELRLRSPGTQWRDFVPLADVCRVVAGCLAPGSVPGGTYNLAAGAPLSVRQMAGMVQDAFAACTGRRPPLYVPDPVGPAPVPYRVPPDRLASYGWTVDVAVEDAVDEVAPFCLDRRAEPPATPGRP